MRPRGPWLVERTATRAIARRDFRGAITVLERSISRRGDDELSLMMLAQCCEWLGEHTRAVEYAGRVLADAPDEELSLRVIVRSYLRLGKPAKAYRHICAALEVPRPPAPPAWHRRLRNGLGRLPGLHRLAPRPARDADWVVWAKEWKAEYEAIFRREGRPRMH